MSDRRSRPLGRNILVWLALAVVVIFMIMNSFSCASKSASNNNTNDLKAAIIDQLFDVQPNEPFVKAMTLTLSDYGFKTIDVYQGAKVDIGLYLRLPAMGYKLIIFRVHSGLLYENDAVYEGSWLFTNELCNQDLNHADQRLSKKIAKARVDENHPWVYAVGSQFVSASMQGNFSKTLVIAMGCYSFYQDDLAAAFIGKGAGVYIGWDNLVNLDYTDQSTEILIKNLCEKRMPLKSALDSTTVTVGPDTSHQSKLRFYPEFSAEQTIDHIIK